MRYSMVLPLIASCAMGAPPGFSPAEQWTMPLVDPLSDGRLLVPVMVHGHGPYLFVLDRDQERSVVDPAVVMAVGVRAEDAARLIDYNDTGHAAFATELTDVEVGTLTVSLVHVDIQPKPNKYDSDGRRIYGVLGRDFLADSIVFGFDRDRGIAWLSTQEAFQPPAGARVVELSKYTTEGVKVPYHPVVEAKVNGVTVDLHPQFASVVSSLAPESWQRTQLKPVDWPLTLVDWAGTPRAVKQLGVAQQVAVDGLATAGVGFAPYDDRRLVFLRLDGMLGLDFFRPFSVAADWHHRKLYLTPRATDPIATVGMRIARWGDALAACKDPGCGSLELHAPNYDDPVRPILTVSTDDAVTHELELVVRATDKTGQRLPTIEINFPAGVHGLATKLAPQYLDAKLEIVDASPFPRVCPSQGGCVMIESPTPP
jgi:hypothetical protein